MPLEEQSNQGHHFLHFFFHLLVVVPYGKTSWLGFIVIKINNEDVQKFRKSLSHIRLEIPLG